MRRFFRLSTGERLRFGQALLSDPDLAVPVKVCSVLLTLALGVAFVPLPFPFPVGFVARVRLAVIGFVGAGLLVTLLPDDHYERAMSIATESAG